jgi:hypothetical protein
LGSSARGVDDMVAGVALSTAKKSSDMGQVRPRGLGGRRSWPRPMRGASELDGEVLAVRTGLGMREWREGRYGRVSGTPASNLGREEGESGVPRPVPTLVREGEHPEPKCGHGAGLNRPDTSGRCEPARQSSSECGFNTTRKNRGNQSTGKCSSPWDCARGDLAWRLELQVDGTAGALLRQTRAVAAKRKRG